MRPEGYSVCFQGAKAFQWSLAQVFSDSVQEVPFNVVEQLFHVPEKCGPLA